jgi:hypothetical protein
MFYCLQLDDNNIHKKNPIYFKGMLIIHLYRKLHFSSFNSPLDNTVKVKAILKFLTASSFVFQTKTKTKTKKNKNKKLK